MWDGFTTLLPLGKFQSQICRQKLLNGLAGQYISYVQTSELMCATFGPELYRSANNLQAFTVNIMGWPIFEVQVRFRQYQ